MPYATVEASARHRVLQLKRQKAAMELHTFQPLSLRWEQAQPLLQWHITPVKCNQSGGFTRKFLIYSTCARYYLQKCISTAQSATHVHQKKAGTHICISLTHKIHDLHNKEAAKWPKKKGVNLCLHAIAT